ncbi:hypothetical protein BV25DRAFT_1837831 [Artomyces pyxidatus]|uniref:Uncharacterized protein n=1 Tax=Artomyces pyxidatus TaxID=48021 RepID=A0ACB8T3W2_9AGAM|nr:hypothetical protein BV25DRAFT_1837831 [Artomyces pyxidatus]
MVINTTAHLETHGESISFEGAPIVIGSPDFLWISGGSMRPQVITLKGFQRPSWRSSLVTNLNRLRQATQSTRFISYSLYGYMTFNNCKYGVLSNWKHTVFFKRVKDRTLEYSRPIDVDVASTGSMSILKAWSWSREPVASASLAHQDPLQTISLPDGSDIPTVYKVVDVMSDDSAMNRVQTEVQAYSSLRHLQGDVISLFYGWYRFHFHGLVEETNFGLLDGRAVLLNLEVCQESHRLESHAMQSADIRRIDSSVR